MDRTAVIEKAPFKGLIQTTRFEVPDELDDLTVMREALAKQDSQYKIPPKPGPVDECMACVLTVASKQGRCSRCKEELTNYRRYMHRALAALRRGELKHTKVHPSRIGPNSILRGFYVDFFARLMGSDIPPTSDQTLFIEQFAIGTSYIPTTFTMTQLGNEIYRAVPDEMSEDGIKTFTATMYLKKSQANPTLNTTVTSSTSTVITVASATGAAVNQRIQVETQNNVYTATITNVAGNNLTVADITGGSFTTPQAAFDAGDIPQSGDIVKGIHCEGGVFIGGSATSSPNTGVPMNRRLFEEDKIGNSLLYDFILACESIEG